MIGLGMTGKIIVGAGVAVIAFATFQTVQIEGLLCDIPDEEQADPTERDRAKCVYNGWRADNWNLKHDRDSERERANSEARNHRKTKQDYRDAQEQASINQERARQRVIAEQQEIIDEVVDSYEGRLARSRTRYSELLHHTANGGSPDGLARGVRLPGAGGAAGSLDEEARHRRLSEKYAGRRIITEQEHCPRAQVCLSFEEAQIATEQAIQLDELITYTQRQSEVENN